MYDQLAELILQAERSDYRFESYCLAAVGKHEGVTYVPTSQTWDKGRDGRATNRGRGSHSNILCATLNDQLDAKSEADLLRVTAEASPDRIVYCSSQRLSEERIDQITASLRRHSPKGSIAVYGAIQLGTFAAADRPTFERSYGPEMQEIHSMILSDQPSGAPTSGMRLALLTFGSSDGSDLREEVLRSTLLDSLSPDSICSADEISKSFSIDLGLSRTLPRRFLDSALAMAKEDGDVELVGTSWKLTAAGKKKKEELPVRAVEQLLSGREIVRARLESLVGKRYSNKQFETIWSGLIDALSALFYANGLEVIQGIDELISASPSSITPTNLKRELETAMRRVASAVITDDLRAETYRALLDLFTEREGPAFEWLTRVSERFVTLCAIGLEHASGEALRETLTAQRVVLDSDVILDYLCKAEPDHTASRDLLIGWLNIGGRILLSSIVLEEVAHNAWISERDFRETEMLLGTLQPWELSRYIKNPFVRTFHSYRAPASKWPMFISEFRGNSPGDYSKILTTLRQRLKAELLPSAHDEELGKKISEFLRRVPASFDSDAEHLEDVLYKVERDGRLLASIGAARASAESSGFDEPMVLLSSSRSLVLAERRFEAELGFTRLVLNKKSFSYLLASVPHVGLGADTLRRALFLPGSYGRLRSDGVRALRLIRATGQVDLPWAERFTLRKELSRRIKLEAERRGISRREMTSTFLSNEHTDTSAQLVVDAMRGLALSTDTQKELEQAQGRIRELEAELATRKPVRRT